MELLALSVGVGLTVSLLCTEIFGIASAGMIVPGYMALYLTQPSDLLATFGVSFATFGLVRLVSNFVIIFGRRRTAVMILVGYVLGLLVRRWSGMWGQDFEAIGFIIPGLIAVWMDRQTPIQTLSSLVVVAILVRLVLIITGTMELVVPL